MLLKITDFIRVLGKKDMGEARRWIPELSRGLLGVHAHGGPSRICKHMQCTEAI